MRLSELRSIELNNISDEDNTQLDSISKHDIAVIGISGRFAEADNLKEYWDLLKLGKDCIRSFPKDRASQIMNYVEQMHALGLSEDGIKFIEGGFLNNIDEFDYSFFGVSSKEASLMDPNQRIFLETAWAAIEDAGYSRELISGTKTGVYIGFSNDFEDSYRKYVQMTSPEDIGVATAGNIKSIIGSRISYLLDLRGPSLVVDTACSSVLVAVHLACQAIRNGECDMAIAGGVKVILFPLKGEDSWQIGIQSPDFRAKTFDERSVGTGLGEGAGSVILKPLYKALDDGDNIYAVIKGSAINQDGNSVGLTTPNPVAQEDVITRAWRDANINPESVSYIEAHGTGTKLGDPIEISGIQRAFSKYTNKKQFCAVGSVKPNIGHLDCSAGIASLIKVILSLKNKQLPPSINFKYTNAKIDFEESPVYVNDRLSEWNSDYPRRCGISSFGLSGTNCHLVLEEAPIIPLNKKVELDKSLKILVLSAKEAYLLKELVKYYDDFFNGASENLDINSITFTASVGRNHYNHRLVILFNDLEDIKMKIKKICTFDFVGESYSFEDIYYGEVKYVKGDKKESLNELFLEEKVRITANASEKLNFYLEDIREHEQSLYDIAKLYTMGADIDWRKFFNGKKVKKVSLPTYPFSRDKCWVKPKNNNLVGFKIKEIEKTSDIYIHPLLDRVEIKSKDIEIYSTIYSPQKHWVLNEHKVNGKCVVPGTTYLEIARAACEKYFGEKVIEMEEFTFLTPLMVDYGEYKEVHTIIKKEKGYLDVSIVSRVNNDDEQWICHAEGRVKAEFLSPIEPYDLDSLKNKFSPEEVVDYSKIPPSAIETGNRWRCIEAIAVGKDSILGKLELPKEYHSETAEYKLHPALMDMAMNLLIRNIGEGLYLPWSYKSLKQYYPIPNSFYSYIRRKGTEENGIEVATFDVTLVDLNGNVILDVEDYFVKKVHEVEERFGDKLDCFYSVSWIEEPLINTNSDINYGNVLVLKGKKNICDELLSKIRKHSLSLVEVDFASNYSKVSNNRYSINGSKYDFLRLFNDLEGMKFDKVINLMSLNDVKEIGSINEFQEALNVGVYSLFELTKALLESKMVINTDFVVISDYGHQITGKEESIKPHNASLYGLTKVIGNEYKNLKCKCIDIDSEIDVEDILAEISTKDETEFVSYRQGVRYVQELDKKNIENISPEEIKIKADGVYVITGGMGGIGLEIAKYLATIEKVNLVLINRSVFPRRENWTGIKQGNIDIKVLNKIKQINEIESLGSKVFIYSGDVCNDTDMNKVFSDVRSKFGRINGLIHGAGVAGNGFVLTKEREKFSQVVLPKMLGTWILNKITENDRLDFFINFSSINTLYGIPGQSDYTAANCYLDSFTEYRNRENKRTITFNWAAWKEVGMAADFNVDESRNLFKSLSTEKAIKAFREIIQKSITKVVVGELNYDAVRLFDNQHQITLARGIKEIIERKINAYENSKKIESNLQLDVIIKGKPENSLTEIDRKIAKVWGQVLGINEVHVDDNFNELGGDSILATQLLRYMEKEFPGYIDIADIFTYSTIGKMSEYLSGKINEKVEVKQEDSSEKLDNILERLSRGEISASEASELFGLEGDE
ncbi:type I polyketide synthase [Clostridium sp. C8-1-8]|uniref:type I polyketide synthase n=1 Tax=Clostridium sp. C8-1-8 TaxID=2698831 RepID=UPI001370380A|nr:type I polyketide synthase [Clostridium sp. C8-1-8]